MRAALYFRFVLFHLLIFSVLRFVFYGVFVPDGPFGSHALGQAFLLGLRFDLRFSLLLVLPMVLFGWRGWSAVGTERAKATWTFLYTIAAAWWMTFYIFDFGFYGYLNSRVNSAILIFLENPDISLGMLWQSYPVVWVLLSFVAMLLVYAWLMRRFVFEHRASRVFYFPNFLLNTVFAFVFLTGLYGSVSQYPLRWSEAFFSPHHFLSHLSLNPILYFFETYSFAKNKAFEMNQIKKYYPTMKSFMGITGEDDSKYLIPRSVSAQPVSHPYNVIVIVMESLALSKTNLMNNPLNVTPSLETLAKEGWWFPRYYSPAEGTARNMFSIMTSIPDVTRIETSTRNPLVVDQKVIANAFKDYKKMYFLGGSANWANIRGIFSHNIEGIDIIEEGSFDAGSIDVWGISDLDLFIEADKRFTKLDKKKPFFAVIQTAGFHRPYTIPEKSLDFKKQPTDMHKLNEAGFYSQEQFDSLRFSDYSLGHFIELTKKNGYYKDTIIVVTGDHGLPDENGVNVPKGSHVWELEKLHVPLIIHNKELIPEPRVDERLGGHADLMTTVASMAGIEHVNTTLGRDFFNKEFDKERYAFLFNYYSQIGEFGLMGDKYYFRFDDVKKGQLYDLSSEDPTKNLKDEAPDVFLRMEEIANAYLEYSRFLLFNNGKDK